MINLLKRKTIVKILLCAIWLTIIFYNCTRQGIVSQRSSKTVSIAVSKFIKIPLETKERTGIKLSYLNFYVRKNAHFFQYLILSILLYSAVRQFKLYKGSGIFLLLFLLLLFPVIDEFIQKYIPGRTSNISDVVIDFGGGILGMIISFAYGLIGYLNTKQRGNSAVPQKAKTV